jgi:hypothetical protein
MKKILFLICFLLVGLGSIAQERTVVLNSGNYIDLNTTKWYAYAGTTSDYLIPTTRDTIDFVLLVKNQSSDPLNFYASITMAPIAGADTTVAITVQQKMFENGTYADLIASALSSAITTTVITNKTTLGVTLTQTNTTAAAVDYLRQKTVGNSDTLNVAQRIETVQLNPSLYYRYLKFRLILQGNDKVGTGIKVTRFEINFFN